MVYYARLVAVATDSIIADINVYGIKSENQRVYDDELICGKQSLKPEHDPVF